MDRLRERDFKQLVRAIMGVGKPEIWDPQSRTAGWKLDRVFILKLWGRIPSSGNLGLGS